MTVFITTSSVMTLSIKRFLATISINDAHHKLPTVLQQSAIVPIVILLSVVYIDFHTECHYAECRYAECRYAECRYAECRYAECCYDVCNLAECHYVECHHA